MAYQSRASIRLNTSFNAQIVFEDGSTLPAKVANLSVAGFRVLTQSMLQKGAVVTIQLDLPNTKDNFSLSAKVVRTEKQNNTGWVCAAGLLLLELKEPWIQTAGSWILAQIETRAQRKASAILLAIAAAFLAFKSVAVSFQLTGFDSPFDFDCPAIVKMVIAILGYPALTILFACFLFFCGLTVYTPRPQEKLFSGVSAMIASGILASRLIIKPFLLIHAPEIWAGLGVDLLMIICAAAGSVLMLKIENHYGHFQYLLRRETIYPENLRGQAPQAT